MLAFKWVLFGRSVVVNFYFCGCFFICRFWESRVFFWWVELNSFVNKWFGSCISAALMLNWSVNARILVGAQIPGPLEGKVFELLEYWALLCQRFMEFFPSNSWNLSASHKAEALRYVKFNNTLGLLFGILLCLTSSGILDLGIIKIFLCLWFVS